MPKKAKKEAAYGTAAECPQYHIMPRIPAIRYIRSMRTKLDAIFRANNRKTTSQTLHTDG
jgi:hypothetical protein